MKNNINIMTWNIDWFRNGNRSQGSNKYLEKDSSIQNYKSIVNEIKSYLQKNENSIVFLQEVPYKVKDEKWHDHFLYKKLFEDFSDDEYDIFANVNKTFSLRCTMSISLKKDNFKKLKSYYPCNNRIIAVELNGYILIGVHMPTCFESGSIYEKFWDDLIKYIHSSQEKIIIAGDFNVYIGCNKSLTESKYLGLLEYMRNCVSESINTYTKGKTSTSIDKILISKNFAENIEYSIRPQHKNYLSDHKYICMKLSFIK